MKNTDTQHDKEAQVKKFKLFTKQIVSVPKTEIDLREAEYKKQRLKLKRKSP